MNNTWYHGTTAEAAREIIGSGKFKVKDEEGSSFYVSRTDRVYISRDIGVGIQHGHARVEHGFSDAIGILEMKLKNPSLLLPDELEFGYSLIWSRRDYLLTKGKDRDDWELIEDEDPEFPYSTWANLDDAFEFYRNVKHAIPERIWNVIDDLSPDNARDQEIAASIGDDVIDHLEHHHPELLERMIRDDWFFNYTTKPSNIIITNAWKGTLGDFQRELTYIDEEIDTRKLGHLKIKNGYPIQARGRGWHDDRYRHSLAARGVRTR